MKLLEISFEVCNKVGGIYTVVSSKAHVTNQRSDYILIGPWTGNNQEFTSQITPDYLTGIQQELSNQGIYMHYGLWDIPGNPRVILLDFNALWEQKNRIKTDLWNEFKIDSLYAAYDFEEPMLFSYAAAQFAKLWKADVVHSHEWMCGFTNLFLKHENIGTVFTTHATMLGRALSSQHINVQTDYWTLDPEHEAKRVNVLAKFTTERACALHSDQFTTVSDTTAKEAHNILGKKPDAVVYNGLNFDDIPPSNPIYRQTLLELRKKILSPYHGVSDDITLCGVFGRNEFVNKGYDMVIEAMSNLNRQSKKTACFFFIPMQHHGVRNEILNKIPVNQIPRSTHYIDQDNEYVQALNQGNLFNFEHNTVEVYVVPIYLDGTDPLVPLTYQQAVQACDLGLFPSYYEPWGYTPLEAAAFGSATVTSNLSGFGQYCQKLPSSPGIFIVDRKNLNHDYELRQLVQTISSFIDVGREEQKKLGSQAKEVVEHLNWNTLVDQYFEVYKKAMRQP